MQPGGTGDRRWEEKIERKARRCTSGPRFIGQCQWDLTTHREMSPFTLTLSLHVVERDITGHIRDNLWRVIMGIWTALNINVHIWDMLFVLLVSVFSYTIGWTGCGRVWIQRMCRFCKIVQSWVDLSHLSLDWSQISLFYQCFYILILWTYNPVPALYLSSFSQSRAFLIIRFV